jgi:TolB-like protein/DNA-binding winged helix-turn-helix (wHTH) protein/tetratricopeptide (TPR) repeat protein
MRFQMLDLEVDAGRQTVTRAGAELHVPKLSFDLLLALLRAAPNTVSVAELMERVWARQVVGAETVAQRVKLLRRALGDDAAQPRYLSGARRRGYRIIAPVAILHPDSCTPIAQVGSSRDSPLPPPSAAAPSATAPSAAAPSASMPPAVASQLRRRRIMVALGLTIVLLVVAALIDLIPRGTHPDAQGSIAVGPAAGAPYTVAVLPFLAMSSRPDDAQLGRGISELVINRLTSERELSVIAPDSALTPRGEAESAVQMGRRLGAHYVIDGNVQREGSQVRVTAQVIDVSAGRHLGALLVERSTAELFHLEDDIAGRVSYFLLGTVHPENASVQEFGAEATLAYLRGRALLAARHVADADAAVQEFTRAIAVAPAFASAYAGRAEARLQRVFLVGAFDEHADRVFTEMQHDLNQALQLDPGNGPALFIRGKYRELQGEHDASEVDYQHAMAISPGFAAGVAYYADFLNGIRHKPEEAISVLDAGIRLNPLAPRLIYLKASFISQSSHDDDAAADLYLRTIQVAPDYYAAYNRLASLRWSQGRLAEAIDFAEVSVRIDPEVTWSRENLARMYIDLGDLVAARDVLAHFHEPNKHEGPALLCYREGRLDAAVAWLHPALRGRHTDTGGPPLAASITALLEQAVRNGDYAAANAELVKMTWLTDDKGALDYTFSNALPLLQLATLEQLAGHAAQAEQIATRVLHMDDDPTAQGNTAGHMLHIRMLALAVLGRDLEALNILEAQRDTMARQLWWVWIERHPAMKRLRGEPRVQQLLADLRAWSLHERARVDAERRAGTLPVRTALATPDPCTPTVVAALQAPQP